jgi:preprotein translocase subunit SecF
MSFDLRKLDYVKKRKKFFILSGTIQLLGLIALLVFGFNLGVDFQSGTRMDIMIGKPFQESQITDELKAIGLHPGSIETEGNKGEQAAVRFAEPLTKEQVAKVKEVLTKKFGNQVDTQENTVDPMISRELAKSAVWAVAFASIGIIIYVTIRFEYRFALSAIIALLHDAFGVIAVFSLLHLEVDLPFISAVLTIVGYSVNDTIVTFDRIRENLKLHKVKNKQDLEHVVNISIQETITRSINTVLTVLFAAVALFIFGGAGLHHFSLALIIGLVFGMYSSVFIASNIWLEWKAREFSKKRVSPASNEAS